MPGELTLGFAMHLVVVGVVVVVVVAVVAM